MATNCPQQLKPRAWRSARCSTTACSNWRRENNCNIWLKMLDTRITAAVVLPTIYVFSTQTVADCYRRRSKPNLDKSESPCITCFGVGSHPSSCSKIPLGSSVTRNGKNLFTPWLGFLESRKSARKMYGRREAITSDCSRGEWHSATGKSL